MQQPDEPDRTEVLGGPGGAEEHHHFGLRTPWRRRSPRGRAVIAATTVAVLALGGTVAYAAASDGSGGPPSASPSASSSHGPGERHGHGGPWSGFADAAHGEATVKDPATGDWVVRVWQRGTVQKADGDRITVRSDDGASWTWKLGPDATASDRGSSGAHAPKKGDTVSVVGTRSGDAYTADRVLSGSRDEHRRDDRHGGFPGHGPWGRGGGDRSAGPTDGGAAT